MSEKTTIEGQGVDRCWGVVLKVPQHDLESLRHALWLAVEAEKDEYAAELLARLDVVTATNLSLGAPSSASK